MYKKRCCFTRGMIGNQIMNGPKTKIIEMESDLSQLLLLEETLKNNPEKFEKMTELEREFKLFSIAEAKEQLKKWIKINKKLNDKE